MLLIGNLASTTTSGVRCVCDTGTKSLFTSKGSFSTTNGIVAMLEAACSNV